MGKLDGRRVYISGPMAGCPDSNGAAFLAAQERLKAAGAVAVNPNRLSNLEKPITREQAMKVDISDLLRCDSVYMLRGWQDSEGATLELSVARAIGLDVFHEEGEGQW